MSADLAVLPDWFGSRAPERSFNTDEVVAEVEWRGTQVESVTDQWIIQIAPQVAQFVPSFEALADRIGENAPVRAVKGLGQTGLILVEANTLRGSELREWLEDQSYIQSFEPNQVIRTQQLHEPSKSSDDPLVGQQWGLHNAGQTGGTTDADIDAPEAWDVSTGNSDIVVGVIDTGVDYTHPDLSDNIWVNPGEIAGNGIDDDGNGFIDDIHGYDFFADDGDPLDESGHGTHVAGTIAAKGNNSLGVTGVAWDTSIMAIRFLGPFGGSTSDAIRAVNYATMMRSDYGVDIRLTNNSWGGGAYSQGLRQAIANSGDEGMLFVAAAGNSDRNADQAPSYPAAYDLDNIISVAASDHNDRIASFSNYGEVSVDLAAPGVGILSRFPGNRYATFQGTSMASPHVAGVAALAWSFDSEATAAEIKQAILDGADDLTNPDKATMTNARLNARQTLELLDEEVQIDLVASVTRSSQPFIAGDTTAPGLFEISIFNASGEDAHGIVVAIGEISGTAKITLDTSALPGNVTWNATTRLGEWRIDEIPASTAETLTLSFDAAASVADGARVVAGAHIQSASEELINTGDDLALIGNGVERRVDLSVHAIPILNTSIAPGESVDVIMGVVNHGPSDASSVSLLVGHSLANVTAVAPIKITPGPKYSGLRAGPTIGDWQTFNWDVGTVAVGEVGWFIVTYAGASNASGFWQIGAALPRANETLINTANDVSISTLRVVPETSSSEVASDRASAGDNNTDRADETVSRDTDRARSSTGSTSRPAASRTSVDKSVDRVLHDFDLFDEIAELLLSV